MDRIKSLFGLDTASKQRRTEQRERENKIHEELDTLHRQIEILRRLDKASVDIKESTRGHEVTLSDENLRWQPGGEDRIKRSLKAQQDMTSRLIESEKRREEALNTMRKLFASYQATHGSDNHYEFVRSFGVSREEWEKWYREISNNRSKNPSQQSE